MKVTINVAEKIATAIDAPVLVCGNSDDVIDFTFDEEWESFAIKTARFTYRRKGKEFYDDVVFEGTSCNIPILSNIEEVEIGVYAGNLRTSTPARVQCRKSILCGGGIHEPPTKDVYNQIMDLINKGGVKIGVDLADQEDKSHTYTLYVSNGKLMMKEREDNNGSNNS